MNILTVLLVLWIVTAPISYFVIRWDQRKIDGTWTQLDRFVVLALSILTGPYGLFGFVTAILLIKVSKTDWARQDAKW